MLSANLLYFDLDVIYRQWQGASGKGKGKQYAHIRGAETNGMPFHFSR
jgi:hypothetical protein